MMSITVLPIIVIVAVVFLMLGAAISSSTSRRSQKHDSIDYPQASKPQPAHSGGGGMIALLLAVPIFLGLLVSVFWLSEESRTTNTTNTTVEYYESAGESTAIDPIDRLDTDRVTRPMLQEASPEGPLTGEVAQAASAASDGSNQQSWEATSNTAVAPVASSDEAGVAETAEMESRVTFFRAPALSDVPTDLLLGGSLLSLAVLISAGIWIAHRRQHWSLSGIARSTVQAVWVVPILASVGWVGYQIWPHLSVAPLVRDTDYNPSQTSFVRYSDTDSGIQETQSQFLVRFEPTSTTPDWLNSGVKNLGGGVLQVPVRSGWRTTEDEARNEARQQAMRTIRQDFALAYPGADQWRIDVALKDLDAVVAENSESKVFPFSDDPMYRTHIQVELSDNVRGEMVKHWWPALQKYRMTMLATFGGLLTLICFAGGACLTLDMRTEGSYRRWLRTATVLVVIAAAAVAHGVLNSLWFQHSV